jgi:cysteine desulfurase
MSAPPVYLDCNATTPVEDEVLDAINHFMRVEYGNAGSRTHSFGSTAAKAVRKARELVAAVVDTDWDSVVFTSGATESNNLTILGLAESARSQGKKHIVSTQIEHKAVLEPIQELVRRGFEATLVAPTSAGVVDPAAIERALRPDTFLVSIMHVNNETGVIQPLRQVGEALAEHGAVFHTDAAQGFGKELQALKSQRLDLISVSAHKIFGPKGIGALVMRSNSRTDRLQPLLYGGGQERGLRPGTIPVALAVGFGVAADLAVRNFDLRRKRCASIRLTILEALSPLQPVVHGDQALTLPHVLSLTFGDIDAEAVILAIKDLVAISTGSACTSESYQPSHVLRAMGLSPDMANTVTRWSWCHLTQQTDWSAVTERIRRLF